ncbi:peptidoglycan recognition family protein [Verrucomicrobiota bacterium]
MYNRRKFFKKTVLALPGFYLGARWSSAAVAKTLLPQVDLKFISSQMDFMPRREWTNEQPKYWLMREAETHKRLTLHHDGNSINYHTEKNAVIHDLDGVLAGHIKRKYGDIGYHFIVDYTGRVWEGRSLAYEGAHVLNENEKNIGVMLMGNFEEQQPSPEQLSSMKKVVDLLARQYKMKKQNVYGHCDLGQTACPGKNLYSYVKKLSVKG